MPDWQKILMDLCGVFGSVRQVGKLIHHYNPDYLTKISSGEVKEPRYSIGALLIKLYNKHVGETIPMIGAGQQKKLL